MLKLRVAAMRTYSIVMIVLSLAVVCVADNIIVDPKNPNGVTTIQAAVDIALSGDIVVLRPGIYTGPGNRDVIVENKALTIQSEDPNDPNCVAATVIDCQGRPDYPHRAFYLNSRHQATVLAGLTIINGRGGVLGGAVKSHGYLSLRQCTISQCSAVRGGAVFCSATSVDVACQECWGESEPIVRIEGCTFKNNMAREGGALYTAFTPVIISRCLIEHNRTTYRGGAITCHLAHIRMENSIVQGNQSDNGGGIHATETHVQVADCVFVGNAARQQGGAAYIRFSGYEDSPPLRFERSTVVANNAIEQTGGLYISNLQPIEEDILPWTINHSILWFNTDQTGSGDHAQINLLTNLIPPWIPPWIPPGYPGGSLVSPKHLTYCSVQDEVPGDGQTPFEGNENIDTDPLLRRVPWDGGDGWGDDPSTGGINEAQNDDFGDVHLEPNSPCIDAGDTRHPLTRENVDLDGQPRKLGKAVDIGADEYYPQMPSYDIVFPAPGELLIGGSEVLITWIQEDDQRSYCAELSIDNGEHWQIIQCQITATNSLLWLTPESINSDTCLIRLRPVDSADEQALYSGVFVIRSDAVNLNVVDRWRTLAGDFQRSGQSRLPGLRDGCVKWSFNTPSAVTNNPTLGLDNHIHIPTADGTLYTLDLDGHLVWSYKAASSIISACTVDEHGTLYAGCLDGSLLVIGSNGHLRDRHWLYDPVASSPAVLSSECVVVGTVGRGVYCLTPDEGIVLLTEQGMGFTSPAVGADGMLYLMSQDPVGLRALEPDHLVTQWLSSTEHNIWPLVSPVVGDRGLVYAAPLGETNLYAYDSQTGEVNWVTDLANPSKLEPSPYDELYQRPGNESWSMPVLGPEGRVYACLNDSIVHAIDSNGVIEWSVRLGQTQGFTMTVDQEGALYTAGDDGFLHIVDPNGSVAGRWIRQGPLSFPIVVSDRTLLVCEMNGKGINNSAGTVWTLSPDPNCATGEFEPLPPVPSGPYRPGR